MATPEVGAPDALSAAESRAAVIGRAVDFGAAVAGFAILIELVGRAVLWARFDAIGLPASEAVSLQPSELLLSTGAGALVVASALGLAAAAALLGVDSLLAPHGVARQGRVVLLVVLELILVAAVAEQPASWTQRLAALCAGLAAGVTLWVIAGRVSRRQLVLSMFLLIAAVGGVLAFVRNSGPPARLPLATVFLKDGSLTTGAFVALHSDTVYLAPDSFNRTYGQLTAIPRSEVRRVALSPPQDFEAAGESTPRALLAGNEVKPPYGVVAPAIARYLAAQAAEPVWKYPPLSFLESAYYISRHPGVFFGTEEAPPVARGRRVSLDRLVAGAREYSGRPVLTRGVVVRTSELPGGSDAPTDLLVTLRGSGRSRAFCVRHGTENVGVGRTVSIEGVVVNAGTVASDSAAPVKGVFLQTAGNVCGV
jgi:hypothetical protein